jgi:EEF1A N-terminal glycine/lysine methyltransferase
LDAELYETESAHKAALEELEEMRETMERMELERAEMIAEVEAQIERALASMAVDVDESEYGSRPTSRMSSRSAPNIRRSGSRSRPLRSFSTDSTLADSFSSYGPRDEGLSKHPHRVSTVPEVDDTEEASDTSTKRKRRFSSSRADLPQDGMTAVDEGINLKSDKIAQKVLQIQRKVCTNSCNCPNCTDFLDSSSRLHWEPMLFAALSKAIATFRRLLALEFVPVVAEAARRADAMTE